MKLIARVVYIFKKHHDEDMLSDFQKRMIAPWIWHFYGDYRLNQMILFNIWSKIPIGEYVKEYLKSNDMYIDRTEDEYRIKRYIMMFSSSYNYPILQYSN